MYYEIVKFSRFMSRYILFMFVVTLFLYSGEVSRPVEIKLSEAEFSEIQDNVTDILDCRYDSDFTVEFTGDKSDKLDATAEKKFSVTDSSGDIQFTAVYSPLSGETEDNGWFKVYQNEIQRFISDEYGVDVSIKQSGADVMIDNSISTTTDFAYALRQFEYREEVSEDNEITLVAVQLPGYRKSEYIKDGRDTLMESINRIKWNILV